MIKFKIRLALYRLLALFGKKKISKTSSGRAAFIFSCPNHGNIGDIAIEQAEIKFLKNYFEEVHQIMVGDAYKYIKNIKHNIKWGDLICIQGGGSFGGLYPLADQERLMIINYFKNSYIFSFPQSIYYKNPKLKKMYQKALSKNDNVYLSFRERMSYDMAQRDFQFMKNRILLSPDIVFSLKNFSDKRSKRSGAIMSFRKDEEKAIKQDYVDKIESVLDANQLNTQYVDTVTRLSSLEVKNTKMKELLSRYRGSQLVVTDRLHGMVLSYITNTPCIAFSNNNGKVKSTYETWLKDCKYIKFMDKFDTETFSNNVDKLLKLKSSDFKHDLSTKFEPLNKIMKGER